MSRRLRIPSCLLRERTILDNNNNSSSNLLILILLNNTLSTLGRHRRKGHGRRNNHIQCHQGLRNRSRSQVNRQRREEEEEEARIERRRGIVQVRDLRLDLEEVTRLSLQVPLLHQTTAMVVALPHEWCRLKSKPRGCKKFVVEIRVLSSSRVRFSFFPFSLCFFFLFRSIHGGRGGLYCILRLSCFPSLLAFHPSSVYER